MKNLIVTCENGIDVKKKNVHTIVNRISKVSDVSISNLEINFVSDETILMLNKKYLKHNYSTDVISFNYSDEYNILDGEIFICLAIAKKNAYFYKVALNNELKRLIVHGILHLNGYKDKTKSQKQIMTQRENILLKYINKYSGIVE